jgi:hypothetical protein
MKEIIFQQMQMLKKGNDTRGTHAQALKLP